MEDYDPKEFLLFALNHFDLSVVKSDEKMIHIEQDYAIEIEGKNLFKLLQGGQVIAPFANAEELCNFIKKDIELNEES